jgi:hypothetical protein
MEYRKLLDNLDDRSLAMARSGTGKQSANSVYRLAAAANDSTDVAPSKFKFEDGCSAIWNFRQNHVVRKFYELANDELEKFSHAPKDYPRIHVCTTTAQRTEHKGRRTLRTAQTITVASAIYSGAKLLPDSRACTLMTAHTRTLSR